MLYLYYLELIFQTWFHLKTPFSKTPLGGGLIGYVKSKPLGIGQIISIDVLVILKIEVKTDVAPSINRCCRPQNCSSESEIQQMALQFWKGPYGGSNQLFMKNGYDHHDHQVIYTYNLSVPKRFTLDVPNQSPPILSTVHFLLCAALYQLSYDY